jgi:serine/threonine protein kinase
VNCLRSTISQYIKFANLRYARYGDVSPKVDVYAFGVVLYELLSAKEAIIKTSDDSSSESKGLVGLVCCFIYFLKSL